MNGVIYARYSSHRQNEESIEQQVDECAKFARENGITVIDIYADHAVSGKTDKRQEFQKMLKDAEKGKFEVVIAYKSNRIARNMLNALQYEERLDKLGIKTMYCKEEFGNNAAGRFAFRMMLNMNQFYSENLAEDIRRGMADNAQQCKVNGSIPLGYKKGEDGKFEIDPEGAAVVREIFSQFNDGVPLAEVADSLNSRGIRTRHNRPFNRSSFHAMLKNDAYIGTYRHSGVVVEGGIPAVLDKSTFQEAQERLRSGRTVRKSTVFYLTGKLFCGRCNSPMTGVSGNNGDRYYYYYACKKQKLKLCDMKAVPKHDIESRVVSIIRDYILTPEIMEKIADMCMNLQQTSDIQQERNAVRRTRDSANDSIKNILAAIEKGIVTDSTKDRLLELEETVRQCEIQLQNLARVKVYDREHILFALDKFREQLHRYTPAVIQHFVKAVYLYDDGIRIDCWYGDGISIHSCNEKEGPPYITQTNILAFAEWFSVRI